MEVAHDVTPGSRREETQSAKDRLRQLAECDKIVSSETINLIGEVAKDVEMAEDNVPSSDEFDEDLEEEYRNLNDILDLPNDTYSLTEIKPELPSCVKYGVRSGLTHLNMPKFSPLSRGHQGGAIAIAAFATSAIHKPRHWNETAIDQIVEDGDTFYCESYKNVSIGDRRAMTVLDLKRVISVRNKFNVKIVIEEPAYAGRFRSRDPTELHLAKAMELFFDRHDAGILTSPVLNVAIWRDSKYYNIFDGQARRENGEPAADGVSGSAKLFLLKNLTDVLFIILQKSNVRNEPFVIHAIIIGATGLISLPDDAEESLDRTPGKVQRRPSGYKIRQKYRAVVQGSYHLTHPAIPEALRGKGHLTVALAALMYSRLIGANRWTTALLDLIFNQSNIYLIDLVRILERKLDDQFELRLDDLVSDIVLGVYSAKVKIDANVIPGHGQRRGKLGIDGGIREFFEAREVGIIEIKKIFYAIWKDGNTYYFLDPFACDDEGFRVDYTDASRTTVGSARNAACVTMNSTVNEVVETVLANTGNRDKDPFLIHGAQILYVKTGLAPSGSYEKIIYREKGTSRRPRAPSPPVLTVEKAIDTTPRMRTGARKSAEVSTQFPEAMRNADRYTMTDDEPTIFVRARDEGKAEEQMDEEEDEKEDVQVEENDEEGAVVDNEEMKKTQRKDEDDDEKMGTDKQARGEPPVSFFTGYRMVNVRRLILRGTKNCLSEEYRPRSRGRQGLITALTALAYKRLKDSSRWRNIDLDQIVDISNEAYEQVVTWIERGRPEIKEEKIAKEELGEEEEEEEEEEVEEEEEEVEEEEEEEEEEEKEIVARAPSHLNISLLPPRLKLPEYDVVFKTKANVVDGDASPLANLAEALERYFERYPEVILENKRLMYAIWKEDEKFFLFNPYGGDSEGWRVRNHPASLVITDGLNELVELLHGIVEYNDPCFSLHFVTLDAIPPGKHTSPVELVLPDERTIEKFRTKFLPITDDDLLKLEETKPVIHDVETEEGKKDVEEEEAEEEEEVEEEEEEEAEEEEEEEKEEEAEKETRLKERVDEPVERALVDPLLEVGESPQPDAPYRLNLALLTSTVRIQEPIEEETTVVHEEVAMERMKYDHPPPYVMPPKRTLRVLLEAKQASKSVPSLVSRFSIDSRLEAKRKDVLSPDLLADTSAAIVSLPRDAIPSKIIKLSSTKYLYSRLPPICMIPLRAIDESYIQDEEIDESLDDEHEQYDSSKNKMEVTVSAELPAVPCAASPAPELVPLGPIIKTPVLTIKYTTCPDERKRKGTSKTEEEVPVVEKSLRDEEKLLFKLIFPSFDPDTQLPEEQEDVKQAAEMKKKRIIRANDLDGVNCSSQEVVGFRIADENTEIIRGNSSLPDRARVESRYFKPCYISAILCILAKTTLDADHFCGSVLDQLILLADRIDRRVGKLQYEDCRRFYNMKILHTTYNIVLKETICTKPEKSSSDELDMVIEKFLEKDLTGILVLANCAYAFWTADDKYYLFDSYPCDEKGSANEEGHCCLVRFRDLKSMLDRMKKNAGATAKGPFRLYTVAIARMETKKRKRKERRRSKRRRAKRAQPARQGMQGSARSEEKQDGATSPTVSELSLIELADWVTSNPELEARRDSAIPGFTPIRYHEASMLEAIVLQDDITAPALAPFKRSLKTPDADRARTTPMRKKRRERIFRNHTSLAIPIDLCVMAWSLIHNPASWSERTIEGLLEASTDYALDNVLASEDTSVNDMIDALLPEFEIANYVFRAVLAPLHYGTLYAAEGWNLAMTLRKIFEARIYTGAIIVCRYAHVAVTRSGGNYFAWWTIAGTKKLRLIASSGIGELLKLIVKEIDAPREIGFAVRAVTISYARKMDPDCSDIKGLHELIAPVSSLPQIYRKTPESRDISAIFKPIGPSPQPIFIAGTVALNDRNSLTEPRTKRCYFVALLAVVIKRDIVQSSLPSMVDRVLETAEDLYKRFAETKFRTEQILRNVPLMNRFFDFRDRASPLVALTTNPRTGGNDFYIQVKKHLKIHFNRHTSGILQFSNCCYGFWYSRSTNCYYYLDPYQCDSSGRKTSINGNACLCVFSSVCQMAKHMWLNQCENTSGFFLHRLHVESIDASPYEKFQEDPMWLYLDYYWKYARSIARSTGGAKARGGGKRDLTTEIQRRFWNNYAIEVTGLIYSVWGTIGAYDCRFGERAGKNRAAVCVTVLAMQHLCHPSKWGPAILDSAVIRGDSYYTESLKSVTRKCSDSANRFRLLTTLRLFPHSWTVDFGASVCGILYDDQRGLTLTAALRLALEGTRNVLVECNEITLAVLAVKDAYYVADPCWIGPPLFAKDRGAIYVLRCRNANALIYAITKMLNTNQRLDVRVTPLSFAFGRPDVDSDLKVCVANKRILSRPVRKSPGRVQEFGRPIPGAVAVPDEDSYLQYQQRLIDDVIAGDLQPEDSQSNMELALHPENANNTLVSTKWHLNLGQANPSKRAKQSLEPIATKHHPMKCVDSADALFEPRHRRISIADLMAVCDDYPIPIDFTSHVPPPDMKILDCANRRSFIREESRAEFNDHVAEISRDFYKSLRHRLPSRKELMQPVTDVIKGTEADIEVYRRPEINKTTVDAAEEIDEDFKTVMTEREITDTEDTE